MLPGLAEEERYEEDAGAIAAAEEAEEAAPGDEVSRATWAGSSTGTTTNSSGQGPSGSQGWGCSPCLVAVCRGEGQRQPYQVQAERHRALPDLLAWQLQ